jgi:DNA-binding LacI/PurR family transcriptional regulator
MRDSTAPNRPITQKDVAERAGVSRAVVSYVINNGPRVVAPETRARVLQAIEDLGYRPNKYAQGLKTQAAEQATGQIGLILGGDSSLLERPYFASLLAGIYREANRLKQQIRFVTFFNELTDPVFFNKNIHPEVISGLIVVATELVMRAPNAREIVTRIVERIDNIVTLEQVFDDLPAVKFDRIGAAHTAVDHLLKLGHQRVAYAGSIDDRLDGYRQALLEHGLGFDKGLVCALGEWHTPDIGYRAVGQLMAQPDPPTAIFGTSDEVSIGLLAGLKDHGLRVPEDVALTSVDDIAFARMIRPALTTVHVPNESFGPHALRMLAMHRDYPDMQPASIVLPTELIVRESCGARLATSRPADGE